MIICGIYLSTLSYKLIFEKKITFLQSCRFQIVVAFQVQLISVCLYILSELWKPMTVLPQIMNGELGNPPGMFIVWFKNSKLSQKLFQQNLNFQVKQDSQTKRGMKPFISQVILKAQKRQTTFWKWQDCHFCVNDK